MSQELRQTSHQILTGGEKFPRRQSYAQYASDASGAESALFQYEWPLPGYPQSLPICLPVNSDILTGRDEPPGPHPGNGNQLINAKIPISRIARHNNCTSSGRVSRACDNCREKKTKCSGNRPSCHRCHDARVQCSYGDRKREKILTQLEELSTQVHIYENLLQYLYPRLDASSSQHVNQTLGDQLVRNSLMSRPKAEATGSLLATLEHTEEDFNRDERTQAVGCVGGHSDLVWLHTLQRGLDHDSTAPGGETPDQLSISSISYFQDDVNILGFNYVDLLGRPQQHVADKLVDDFFQAVHPVFPIIGRGMFLGQYRSLYMNPYVCPGKRWLAILNLVFAIAAKHSLLADSQPEGDVDAPSLFFARAWWLSIDNVALMEHPNLEQVQVEGLAAFYLLSAGQVNKSWRLIGLAIRSAVAIGLNLRSEADEIGQVSKETRYRVWWALFTLDTMLSVMKGRPPSISDKFCTTPLPIPYREEDFGTERIAQLITNQGIRTALMESLLSSKKAMACRSEGLKDHTVASFGLRTGKKETKPAAQSITEPLIPNISLYFLYTVDLAFLTREAIQTLYAPGVSRRPWLEMETTISGLSNTADSWLSCLPAEFQFKNPVPIRPFAPQRTSLAFSFYATKILISQPCLRHLAYQRPGTGSLGALCDTMAAMCVKIARQMLELLPDEADTAWLYTISPWWCIPHYIMQPTTILLVELFTRTQPRTPKAASLVKEIQKAIRWLREMSPKDPSSRRAFLICTDILSRHGSKFAI